MSTSALQRPSVSLSLNFVVMHRDFNVNDQTKHRRTRSFRTRVSGWRNQTARFLRLWLTRLEQDRLRGAGHPKVEAIRWMLEDIHGLLSAQQLKMSLPVSFNRLDRYWAGL